MSSRNDDGRQSLVSGYRGSPPDSLARPGRPDQEVGLDGQQKQMVAATSREGQLAYINQIDRRLVVLSAKWFEPVARFSIFLIYFYFGFLKVLSLSPATPLAQALTAHTIGMQYFNTSFKTLAVFECIIGLLFLIPALTRLSIALIIIHLGVVSSPLVIVPSVAFIHPLVPTLEGQYIIKDLAILALAIGIMAQRQLPSRQ